MRRTAKEFVASGTQILTSNISRKSKRHFPTLLACRVKRRYEEYDLQLFTYIVKNDRR